MPLARGSIIMAYNSQIRFVGGILLGKAKREMQKNEIEGNGWEIEGSQTKKGLKQDKQEIHARRGSNVCLKVFG
jgi:hypothetical protein